MINNIKESNEIIINLMNICRKELDIIYKLLDLQEEKETQKYNKLILDYKTELSNEEKIYKYLKTKKELLFLIDKILTEKTTRLNDVLLTHNEKEDLAIIKIYKKIDEELILSNSSKIDKCFNLISNLELYDIELNTLYYLNQTLENKANLLFKKELTETMHKIIFTSPIIEKNMLERKFTPLNTLINYSSYYISNINIPEYFINKKRSDMYIDALIDQIRFLEDLTIIDMLNTKIKIEIHTVLSYIKSLALFVDNNTIKSLKDSINLNNKLMEKIIKESLEISLNDKTKTLKITEIKK